MFKFTLSGLRACAVASLFASSVLFGMSGTRNNNYSIKFVDSAEAGRLLSQPDKYTDGWGRFDLEARTGRDGATRADLLKLMKENTCDFTEADKDTLEKAFKIIDDSLAAKNLILPLPGEFVLAKTTMKEEGGASAYTRGDIICVSDYVLGKVTADRLARLLAHEMFHVMTRDNKEFRKAMYAMIGFNVLDREITFAQDVLDKRISNPDVNRYDSYAMLTVDGKKSPYSMLIYSEKDFSGGSFFNYVKIGLVPLDKQFNPVMEDGKTVIVPLERATDFYDLVGKNTGYVINPEECLADNFSFAVCGTTKPLPNPEIIDRIIQTVKSGNF